MEDLSYIVLLRKKFHHLESIPGVLLPHPSSSIYPYKTDAPGTWPFHPNATPQMEYYNNYNQITPSMSSLEALLSKLPSVVPTSPSSSGYYEPTQNFLSSQRPSELMGMGNVAKEETEDEFGHERDMGESSSSLSLFQQQQQHYHHINVKDTAPNKGF